MYTREDEVGWQQSKHFKEAFSVDVRVDFLGAWYLSKFLLSLTLLKMIRCTGTLSVPLV